MQAGCMDSRASGSTGCCGEVIGCGRGLRQALGAAGQADGWLLVIVSGEASRSRLMPLCLNQVLPLSLPGLRHSLLSPLAYRPPTPPLPDGRLVLT